MRNMRIRSALLVVAALIIASVPGVSATLTGVVSIAGGGPLVGIQVRTDGSPSYTATTGTDGSYSVTVPSGNFAALANAPGYTPQRMAFSTVNNSSVICNFALNPAAVSGQAINLPAPLVYGEPAGASAAAPGDNFPVRFGDMTALPDPNAPRISEWNDCVKPDESFTLAGYNFTTRTGADAGTDTTVWIWARTSASGGVLRQARVWRVSASSLVATVPDDVPFGMYLVWVQNSVGVGAPICLNKTTSRWIGPIDNTISAGSTKRVFGRNLTYGHGITRANSSDPVTSYVYIQPAGGGAFIACPTSAPTPSTAPNLAEPYSVMFTVPVGTANGNYKLYVHNGHGGAYGWSDGLDIVVKSPWVRGSGVVNLSPRGPGLDDTAAIQSAINTASGYPGGGTVQLSAGNFIVTYQINSGSNVNLKGAGMDSTTLLWHGTGAGPIIRFGSDNSALSYLTVHQVYGYGIIYSGGLTVDARGTLIDSVRVDSDQGDDGWKQMNDSSWLGVGTEVRGCEMYREVISQWNGWIHDNNLYGDVGPWYYAEGPCELFGANNVFENNHVETRNWPLESNGTRNYAWWEADTVHPGSTLFYRVWAKRMVLCYCNSSYVGHNNTKDVAVDDNRGEMVLFHGHGSFWFGQVLSNNGLTMTVRTDGTVFGQTGYMMPKTYYDPYPAGQPLTNSWDWWASDNGSREIVIIAGKGAGQIRHIPGTGITPPDQITVDKPWLVEPDSTSVALFGGAWWENIVYDNELNAFPPGYSLDPSLDQAKTGTASCGIVVDGNSYHLAAESNTSRRTNYGRQIKGSCDEPSLWNEMRDEQAIDSYSSGYNIMQLGVNPVGTMMYGNAFRNCGGNVLLAGGEAARGQGMGAVLENMNVTSTLGYRLGFNTYGWDGSPTLYRNGTITVNNSPNQPVYIGAANGNELLVNNKYYGTSQAYWGSSFTMPVPLQRVARFSGNVGQAVQDVLIPIVNAGTDYMTWQATPSDSWITASIQSNGTLNPESTMGRLAVSVNTSGMTAGTHWGYVDVSAGSGTVRVGVSVNLASGTAANQNPSAVFAANPVMGPAPRTVTFDASRSIDLDGSIVSYYWDFGDGSYGNGITAVHTYGAQGTYTPVLTVTDNGGLTDSAWMNISISAPLTSLTLAGVPGGLISPNTTVTLTATATGGYQTQFKFLLNAGNGWVTLRDYQAGNTCQWTPTTGGYYEVKVEAKNSDSTNAYDIVSSALSYPINQIPVSGMKLWLKADTGVTTDVSGNVTGWTDLSGSANNVTQPTSYYQPTWVDNVINGRPVVRFAGTGEYLQAVGGVIPGTGNFTSFEVVRFRSLTPGTAQYIWWTGATDYVSGYGTYLNTRNPQRLWTAWGQKNAYVEYPSDITVGNCYRVSSRFVNPNNQMWVNGNYVGQTTKYVSPPPLSNLGGGAFTVGNYGPTLSNGFIGDIAEMFVYNRDLTESERTSVETYLTARWNAPTAITKDRIKDVKALGDGVMVSITLPKVATVASGTFSDGGIYIQELDRTCGMKVLNAGSVNLWDNLIISGTTDTDPSTGERILRATLPLGGQTSGTDPGTLGMTNKVFSATGQLVRVWGKVTSVIGGICTIDDGSGSPVTVQTDGLSTPLTKAIIIGEYVSITGPAALTWGGVAIVRPRFDSDIQIY